MMKHIEKHRLRQLRSSESKAQWRKKPVLISCKQKKFNHHIGQTYSDLSVKDLASANWKSRRSKSDYFTINAFKSVSLTRFTFICLYFFKLLFRCQIVVFMFELFLIFLVTVFFCCLMIMTFLSTAYLHISLVSGGVWSFNSAKLMQAIVGHTENSLCLGFCSATVVYF